MKLLTPQLPPARALDLMLFYGLRSLQPLALLLCLASSCIGTTQAAPESRYIRNKGSDTVIIFVHGLGGDSVDTWTNGDSYWPQLIADDQDFAQTDIFVYHYPTSLFSATLTPDQIADDMYSVLMSDKVLDRSHLVFLSHSMGGVVTRAMLLRYPNVATRVLFLQFFATPGMGSAWADALWLLNPKQAGKLTSDIIADYLGNQARDWQAAPFASSIPSYCAYESKPTLGKIVVSMESATYLCTRRSEGVDANHADIVKPKDRSSQPYAFFKANFIAVFENLTARSLSDPSPVIVVDCHLATLPNIMPSNGFNELDLVYTPGDGGGGPIGTGGRLNQPGERLTWSTDLIGFPVMYCELTTEGKPLYSVNFDLHVKFNTVTRSADGQIGPGQLLKERDWPIGVARLSNNYSFGFYAFTTGQNMVFATFSSTAQYLDPDSNNQRAARLVVVNWQALSFAPVASMKSVPTSP